MVPPIVKSIIYRGVLPLSLLFGAFLRPCFISAGYVLLAIICPALPGIKKSLPVPGSVRAYLFLTCMYSIGCVIAQISYQIYEPIHRPSEEDYINQCNSTDVEWWKYSGFIRFKAGHGFNSARSILPEILATVVSLVSLVVVGLLSHRTEELDVIGDNVQTVRDGSLPRSEGGADQKLTGLITTLKRLSNLIIFVLAAVVGCVHPSILNSMYFISFLLVATWWAAYKPLRHKSYNFVKRFLLLYAACHILAIYVYQIQLIQQWIPVDSLSARLVGLSPILLTDCTTYWSFWFNLTLDWPALANPFVLLVFYHLLLAQLAWTAKGSRIYFNDEPANSSVHEENGPRSATTTTLVDFLGSSDTAVGSSSNSRPRGSTLLLANEDGTGEPTGQSFPLSRVTSQTVDRHKISAILQRDRAGASGDKSIRSAANDGIVTFFFFTLHHAYVLPLFTIMTWALLYHSIFGLTLLVLACVLWMFKDTRKACFNVASVLLAYVEILLIIQYMCSMDLRELGDLLTDWMQMIGLVMSSDMIAGFVTLSVKLLLSLPVFLLLRLSRREKFYESLSDHERSLRIQSYGTFSRPSAGSDEAVLNHDQHQHPKSASFVNFLAHFFSQYWIFVVALILLLVSVQSNPCLYTIGFFCFWAICVINCKVSLGFFRISSYLFWLTLIFYTSLVIISLYIYQFPGLPDIWIRWTGISKEWNDDIGLINYSSIGSSSGIISRLFWPIFLFAVAMLQLKFFHEPWNKMVQAVRADSTHPNGQQPEEPREKTIALKLKSFVNDLITLFWRIAEVHVTKVVFIILAVFICKNICAIYFPVIVFLTVALCLPGSLRGCMSLLMCVYLCLVALFKMVYQLKHIPDFGTINIGGSCNASQNFAQWLGVEKNANTWSLLHGLLVGIIALAAQSIVLYKQRHARIISGEPEEYRNRVFPHFDMTTYDESIVNAIKFLIDFGFYKFGFECTVVMMALDAWVRMDMLAVIICIWLAVFALNRRSVVRGLWPIFILYLAIILPLQYAFYVGLPEESCVQYPWSSLFSGSKYSDAKNTNFDIWMGLSNYNVHWPSSNLVADFFVLLFASCQLLVFRAEGEENDSIYKNEEYYLITENPVYDFMSAQRSFVDFAKILIFHYGHWITLITTLVAGIGGTSLFALGYIILTLYLLWKGNNLYVMNEDRNNFKTTLHKWKILISYTIFTMFSKASLQIFGCVFLEWFKHDHACFIRQIFSITCVNTIISDRGSASDLFADQDKFLVSCPVNHQEAQMGFDAIALAFLIFQMRAFHSWYFQHCMMEYRSEVVLASRGAVLKNQLIEKEMKEQNIQQSQKFQEIQTRTKAIRERYNKQLAIGVSVFEPQTYGQAKRAGDYYMFDYDPNTDELVEPVESFVPETDPAATKFDKLDPGQLVYAATSQEMDYGKTLKVVADAEKKKDPEERMIQVIRNPTNDLPLDDTQESSLDPIEQSGVFKFLKKIFSNTFDMIAVFLNRMSREHRYVAFVLAKEKEKMKGNYHESLSDTTLNLKDLRGRMDMNSLRMVHTEGDIEKMEIEAHTNWQQRSAAARLLTALGNCVLANTDIICYFLAVLAHAMGAGLITLPLPLMVFLWGTLSNPRPSKSFWVTMIAYTSCMITIKFVFQFTIFEFNQTSSTNKNIVNPMTYPKVFGIQRQDGFALFDVPLLFALFFHRYMLRKFGLWKDANLTVTFVDNEQPVATESLAHSRDSSFEMTNAPTTSGTNATPSSDDHENRNAAGNEVVLVTKETPEEPKNPISRFIQQLFRPKFRYIRDMYPIMFGLDVLAFLIVSFGYSSFGEGGSGNVIGDIQKSRIPLTLVVMLIAMTLMIVADRGLYLRKWVYGKLAYQLLIIVFIHSWIFFILPLITKREASQNTVAQFLYLFKCMYLLVSAWQIRNGYPQLCIGNLLTHGYGVANMVFFKIFMAVPFLFELRTAIDWTWTDTSMPLFDFFTMENFYSLIYNLKCNRTFESNYPAPRGQAKGPIVKYAMGFPMILLIVFLVWAPLLIFSLLNQIGDISIPNRVKLTMALEGYPPIYQIEAQGTELHSLSQSEYKTLEDVMSNRFVPTDVDSVKRSRNSVAFMKDYSVNDILVVEFRPESEIVWPISEESLNALKKQLASNSSISFQLSMEFSRPYDPSKKIAEKHSAQFNQKISNDTAERAKIISALEGSGSITIEHAFPSYLLVPNEGEVTFPEPVINSIIYNQNTGNGTKLKKTDWFDTLTINIDSFAVDKPRVWMAQATHPSNIDPEVYCNSTLIPYGQNRYYVQTVAFIDKAYPSFFAKYLQGGIITMYATLIIVAGRLIRGVFTNSPTDVMISEIPNPDYLLKICLDIYLVREAKDFFLEQDLFAKLIFLFRSPATLIQWTRYKVKNE